MIAILREVIKKRPDWDHTLTKQVIKNEQTQIKTIYADLKEMQRWWNRRGA